MKAIQVTYSRSYQIEKERILNWLEPKDHNNLEKIQEIAKSLADIDFDSEFEFLDTSDDCFGSQIEIIE